MEKKPTRRQLKRKLEGKNRLWRGFNRQGVDGLSPNDEFLQFYRSQLKLEESPKDWEEFIRYLATDLPVTFRVNRLFDPFIASSLQTRLQSEFQFNGKFVQVNDHVISGRILESIPWYKDGRSLWQINASRSGFSKTEALQPLYQIVTREAKLGNLARQEIASMLPAMALKVNSEHLVLDLCASPGSKTEQILELMRDVKRSKPIGCVVANDADPKRIKHMLRRFSCIGDPKLIITCEDGEKLCRTLKGEAFDRVLCDVPCTGDGTIRKMPYLWRRWDAQRAFHLHPLQLELLKNAASALKVGGRLVYSTCSFNPFENEAVVLAFLSSCEGSLKLVSPDIPHGFKTRKGLKHWDFTHEVTETQNRVEVCATHKRRKVRKYFNKETMMSTLFKNVPDKFGLEKCVRVYPHDNNTGGFFLAAFEKLKSWQYSGCDAEKDAIVQARRILKESGYTVSQRKKDNRKTTGKIIASEDDFADINNHFDLAKMETIKLIVKDRRLSLLSKKALHFVQSWSNSFNIVSAGAGVANIDPEVKQLCLRSNPYSLHQLTQYFVHGCHAIPKTDFARFLEMCTQLVQDDKGIRKFPVNWLADIFIEHQSVVVLERLKALPLLSIFSLFHTYTWKEESFKNGVVKTTSEKHRIRISRKERKKLRKQNRNLQLSIRTPKSPQTYTFHNSQQVYIILVKLESGQFRILTPFDKLQSISEAFFVLEKHSSKTST